MAIKLKCPACGYHNHFNLDDLMGRYAACQSCATLLKVIDGEDRSDKENAPKKKDKK